MEPEEIAVPELAATELRAALAEPAPPLILDVREQYEWNQVHLPEALHIPVNEVPARLGDLPRDRRIAVLCAHGSRSYGVDPLPARAGFRRVERHRRDHPVACAAGCCSPHVK
jgi:rhodanese-related sulfurtransferase